MVDIRALLPDFLPTNQTDSKIYKYAESHNREFDEYEDDIAELKTGLYLDGQIWDEWQSDISYELGERVSFEGLNYRALSNDQPNVSLGELPNPKSVTGIWNPDAEVQTDITIKWDDSVWDDFKYDDKDQSLLSGYDRGEEVLHEGGSYRALSDLVVIEPNSVSTEWEEGVTYDEDRYVTHEGISYRARVETSDEPRPVLFGDWKPIWKGLWQRFDDPNLDRVGALFGDVGERSGRNDVDYRQYLQSLVEAFRGTGEKKSIRKVVGSAIVLSSIEQDDVLKRGQIDDELLTEETSLELATAAQNVEVEENFEELEYDLRLSDWDVHAVSSLVDIANVADPSGVTFGSVAYDAGPLEPSLEDTRFDDVTVNIKSGTGYGTDYGSNYGNGGSDGDTKAVIAESVSPTVTEYEPTTAVDSRFTDVTHTVPIEPTDILENYVDAVASNTHEGTLQVTEAERVVVDDGVQPVDASVDTLFSTVEADEFDTLGPVDDELLEVIESLSESLSGSDTTTSETLDQREETSLTTDTRSSDVSFELRDSTGYGSSYGANYGTGSSESSSGMSTDDTVSVDVTDV